MIYAGTDLKYRVTTQLRGFSLKNDEFTIKVRNRWQQVKYLITKDDCLFDDDGNYYFMLENVQNGTYYAELIAEREDDDYDDGVQHVVDQQILVVVGSQEDICGCMEEHDTDGMTVVYQRVWTVSIDDGVYLADCYGNPIITSDGSKIRLMQSGDDAEVRLSMTAEQVKQLLEGHSDNGKIDTIPEVMDVMGGLDEDTEYSTMTDSDTDSMMNRILGRNNR